MKKLKQNPWQIQLEVEITIWPFTRLNTISIYYYTYTVQLLTTNNSTTILLEIDDLRKHCGKLRYILIQDMFLFGISLKKNINNFYDYTSFNVSLSIGLT